MKTTLSFVAAVLGLMIFSGCTNWVAGQKDDAQMKKSSHIWGIPQIRPVVWGFAGIDRTCTEKDPCPSDGK